MFPKQHQIKNFTYPQMMSKQKGFLVPLAIFIVVIMAMFGMVLSRNSAQSTGSSTLEVVTLQTFYAAESGNYRGMQTLFFPDSSSRQAADARCAAINTTYTFNVTGLNACSTVVTCTCAYSDASVCASGTSANYSDPAKLNSFYTVSSVATCGNGILRSVRTVMAGAML